MNKLIFVAALIGLVSACGTTPVASSSPSPQPSASASPSASPSSSPSVAPSPSVAVSPTMPAGFAYSDFSGGAVASSTVTDVRVGQHDGYDRFVIEFSGGVPTYTVTRQSNATFTRSPKGDLVTLDGTAGVLIVVRSVSNWTSYSGPTGFKPGYPCLRQALMAENFEGVQQWALGIAGKPALRVFTMDSPSRLVVDVAVV